MVGTPAELRSRNAQLQHDQPTRFGPSPPQTPASTVPLGFSPGLPRGQAPAEEMHLRQSMRRAPVHDTTNEGSGSDILLSLARQPVERRLLALEQYVFEQHTRDVFSLNLKTRTLENKMSVVLGDTTIVGPKAKRFNRSVLSSPMLTEDATEQPGASHGSGTEVAGGAATDDNAVENHVTADVIENAAPPADPRNVTSLAVKMAKLELRMKRFVHVDRFDAELFKLGNYLDDNSYALEKEIETLKDQSLASSITCQALEKGSETMKSQSHGFTHDLHEAKLYVSQQEELAHECLAQITALSEDMSKRISSQNFRVASRLRTLEAQQDDTNQNLDHVHETQLEHGFTIFQMQAGKNPDNSVINTNDNLAAPDVDVGAAMVAGPRGAPTIHMADSMSPTQPVIQTQPDAFVVDPAPIQPTSLPPMQPKHDAQFPENGGFFQFDQASAPAPPPPPGMSSPQISQPWQAGLQPPQPQHIGHVDAFDLSKWQISDLRKCPPFNKFDGTTQHYRAWHMQLENFTSTVNQIWVGVLNMVRHMPYEIKQSTFDNTSMCMGLSGMNLNELSSVLWNGLTATLHELYLPQLEALPGGPNRNGFEVYRKLDLYHGKGSVKQRVKGLRQLQRYPRCDRLENLERELLNWKLLMQQFGNGIDPEHAFVMFSDFVPKPLEEEFLRQIISNFHDALNCVEEALSPPNGDRLAESEERRIQMSMHAGKPSMPFINAVTDGAVAPQSQSPADAILQDPEAVQQIIAAVQQQQFGRRTPSGRPTPGIKAANWQGGACFECGSTDHARKDCPEFIRLNALPGGYPKDHMNEYSKWKRPTDSQHQETDDLHNDLNNPLAHDRRPQLQL